MSFRRSNEDFGLRLVEILRELGYPQDRPTPTSRESQEPSALQAAISSGYRLLADYLLDWGADIDHDRGRVEPQTPVCDGCESCATRTRPRGRSPLLTALEYRDIEVAKMLFGRNPNLKIRGGEQKLAMEAGDDTTLVNMLLHAGSPDVDGLADFLEQAIVRRNPKSIRLLSSVCHDWHASIDPLTTLRAALITGDLEIANQQIPVCDYDSLAMYEAVFQSYRSKDYHPVVERLLETRPNIPNDSFEILAVASAAIHRDSYLMRVLVRSLSQGPWVTRFPLLEDLRFPTNIHTHLADFMKGSIGFHTCHILEYAALLDDGREDTSAMTTLREFEFPIKGMHLETALYLAPETLKRFIEAGAEPDLLDLHTAVCENTPEHVEVLCEAGFPLNAMYSFASKSRIAVQEAVECGSLEVLEVLLRYSGDVKHPAGYNSGATCLQITAFGGHIGLVHMLLDKGAKVNEKRSLLNGRTAIENAAAMGSLDILKLLLLQDQHLLRTTAERYQFIRAARMAEEHGYRSIVKMLKEHISWDSNDQRLFDDCGQMIIHLDDMTQKPLECEICDPSFFGTVEYEARRAGFENVYDIDGIERWIGEPARWFNKCSQGLSDSSSGAEGGIPVQDSLTTSRSPEPPERMGLAGDRRNLDGHPSGQSLSTELLPPHDGIDDASADPGDYVDQMRKHPAKQRFAWSLNSEPQEVVPTVAPQAIHHQAGGPTWLEMQEEDMHDIMHDPSGDLTSQIGTSRLLAHRPVAQSVSRESGMVLGEVLDEVPWLDATGDDTVDHNIVGAVGEEGHPSAQIFNWDFWDDESFGFHSGQLEL